MKIGFCGMGKLGLPVALAVESKGHEVMGYDISPRVGDILHWRKLPYQEVGAQELLDKTNLTLAPNVADLVFWSDLIFVAVQTPHEPRFEGATRLPEDRADFDYFWLKDAVQQIAEAAKQQQRHITVVVISTCLPGTFEREIEPLLNNYVHYVYNPFFIAMGTVIPDFLQPEFVLVGYQGRGDRSDLIEGFYRSIHNRPLFTTDITTAEGIKVFYNTFITMKTVLANTYGEMAHKLGMNVDDIYTALSLGTDRIISPRYLRAGMGDGGGCHPRDNIALSFIARQVNLSHNLFEDLMRAREDHAQWLADLIAEQLDRHPNLPVVILGRAFKPETNIETGSPSVLVANLLHGLEVPFEHIDDSPKYYPSIYFIGTQNARYQDITWPAGSVVIDPFGYIKDQPGIEVIRIGRP